MSAAWETVKLGEVVTPVQREEKVDAAKKYHLLGVRLEGQGPFHRETVMGTQTSATKLFRVEEGDFIYSRLFACRGAFGVITEDLAGCHVSNEFPTFVPVSDKLDVRFLKYWFRQSSIIALVDADCTGSTPLTRNRYKENYFLALEIPIPPLAEQRRIVARIEELAAQINTAQELRKQAENDTEMLFQRTVSARLDDSGRQTFLLGEILSEKPRNGLSPQPETDTGGRMMLRINAVSSSQTRYVDMSAAKRVQVTDEIAEPFVVKNDDVFIVRYNGDINRVGKPAIYKGLNKYNAVYPDKLIRLRPDAQQMSPDFLVFALSSRAVRTQIENLGKTTAGNIGISGGNIQSFRIPVPSLSEQRRIVAELDALQAEVDVLKRLQAETAAELDALLPAVLDRAFKGEL